MCNLNEDLVEYFSKRIPGVGNFKVDVNYSMLSDACVLHVVIKDTLHDIAQVALRRTRQTK